MRSNGFGCNKTCLINLKHIICRCLLNFLFDRDANNLISSFICCSLTYVTYIFSAIAVRDRLESLCRELQRQNKLLMVGTRFTSCTLIVLYASPSYLLLLIKHDTSSGLQITVTFLWSPLSSFQRHPGSPRLVSLNDEQLSIILECDKHILQRKPTLQDENPPPV